MTFAIPIRRLLAMRNQISDRVLLDYLDLVTMAREPGFVATEALQQRWRCHQCNVSRRMARLADAGLVDVTSGHGGYNVHELRSLEAAA